MKTFYFRHQLLALNLGMFFLIGLLLSLLLNQVLFILLGIPLGGLLGWLGGGLGKVLQIREKYSLRWALVFLIFEALIFIYGGIPAIGAYQVVHPRRVPVTLDPAQIGSQVEEISFITSDGLALSGWYFPSQNSAAVILAHGLHSNRGHPAHQARVLVEAGYGVLIFDLRCHGHSECTLFTGTEDVGLDVQAAAAYLQTRADVDPERIGALGLSVGANAVLYAAGNGAPIQAMIADGTGMARTEDALQPMLPEIRPVFFGTPLNKSYHFFIDLFSQRPAPPPIKEIVPGIAPSPILFIAGEGEWLEPTLAQRYASEAGENASIWLAPGSTHNRAILDHPQEYRQRILGFYDQHLLVDIPE